jgi:RNase H-fold protein (predicted Holliday junction resolvase)
MCIRIKESVDKEALAKLTDERLSIVKARRKSKDAFFVEPTLTEAADKT